MFELPEAKRIRREDLETSDDAGRPSVDDAALRASLQSHLARSLGLNLPDAKPATEVCAGATVLLPGTSLAPSARDDENKKDGVHGEFEFRLFSTTGAVPKVVLDVDDETRGEGDIIAKRPLSHYLATNIPAKLRQEYEMACVSGEDVLTRSRCRSWGLELPWKVTTITTIQEAKPAGGAAKDSTAVNEEAKRKRPGKKTRIALRKKERAVKEREQLTAKQEMDKSQHLKNKKMRINRAKKLRKRAKVKEKKLAAVEGDANDVGSDDESDGPDVAEDPC
ncbi:hypothetical protein XA68_10988 [Ophiocordyceps unilateralis]|uniref:Uncharacterized protein n=1 Tax=Ophiocordyceps unilateralis TaxID=268505 RepID=A0A2A9PN68_OPHUN|nr:hypothetical protein XA68_10988 [Ophiocordyceps unilateralis]